MQCQQATGAAFGAWVGIEKSGLSFDGPIGHYRLSDIATRSFCTKCGGTLTMQYDCYPEKTHVAAGTIVKGVEKVPKVDCHLFVSRKPVWYVMPDDGVRRWEEFDDGFVEVLQRWKAERVS